jgi:hypothetical protein
MKKNIIALSAAILSATAAQASDATQFSGFTDAQWTFGEGTSGASIADGAVRMSKSLGEGSINVDIPFSLSLVANSNDFNLGQDKAQAYISYKYANGLSWRLGQWDGIFGLERNDSPDFQFTRHGALWGVQAKTHTGLMVGYALSDKMNVDVYVAGVADQGSTNTSTDSIGDTLPELGAKFSMSGDLRLSLGASYAKVASDLANLYINGTAGMAFGALDLGLDIQAKKSGNEGDLGLGAGVTGIYGVSDSLKASIRAQYLSNINPDNTIEVTVGPQYDMTKDLRVKVDYTLTSSGGTSHSGAVAAVYSF